MENLITNLIDTKNGYINLSRLKDSAIVEQKRNGNISFEYDGKMYFFKLSSISGGVNFRSKEIYESLISKILKKYTPTVEYHPATYKGKKGVVCEHWQNFGTSYMPFHKALKLKGYEHASRIGSVADFEDEYEDGLGYDGIKRICAKDCLDGIRKAPVDLMAGNCDFKLSNTAVRCMSKIKLRDFMSFDYGFNLYNLVDAHLKMLNLPITKDNVAFSINRVIEEWFYINLTFGATKNCCNYDDIHDLSYDFYCYAQRNKAFKNNLEIALSMQDDLSDVFAEMKDKKIILSTYKKELIKRVMEYMQKRYDNILN